MNRLYYALKRLMSDKIKSIVNRVYGALNTIFFRLTSKVLCRIVFVQFIKHYFVGFAGAAINYIIFNVLIVFGFGIVTSNAITHASVIIITFIMQKFYTYRAGSDTLKQFILYLVCAVIYFALDTLLLMTLIRYMSITPIISKIISLFTIAPLSFVMQKYIVFRK